ncbi:MAG TPA: thioredoxin [Actinomycetota bacterium]|nr:thioredoxin [Actinomycetota bacterium]
MSDVEARPTIVEVTDETFVRDVVEESYRRPVVVDFWAAWCRPCLMIGPVLERLAEEHGGEFLLAKLDVDANPQTAMTFRIQSIPAVKAFRDGQVVSEFVGAIPETSIRQWLQAILPSRADRLAERGEERERAGALDEAEALYRQALREDPRHRGAALGLGRVLAQRGELGEAKEVLRGLRPDPDAERLLAAIEVSEWAAAPDGEGALARGQRAAAEGRWAEALEAFLEEIRSGDREQGREAMLKVFSVLGEEDPLTQEYRRKLAAALF